MRFTDKQRIDGKKKKSAVGKNKATDREQTDEVVTSAKAHSQGVHCDVSFHIENQRSTCPVQVLVLLTKLPMRDVGWVYFRVIAS